MYPAAEPVAPTQHGRWMTRDEAGHTHSIPSSLGRALSKSRWKSLRTLNSPDSFSASSTPPQPRQIRDFSNELNPSPSPPTYTPVFFSSQERLAKRSVDHWVCVALGVVCFPSLVRSLLLIRRPQGCSFSVAGFYWT